MGGVDDPGCGDDVLHRIGVGDHQISECPSCSGIHVDHETLERITRAREADAGIRLLGGVTKSKVAPEPVRYRKCPACEKVMNRRNFGERSGIIVDVCKADGVWFDPEELTAVLEFVASGGLQAARIAERDRAKQDLSRHRMNALHEQMRAKQVSYSGARSGGALLSALVGWSIG